MCGIAGWVDYNKDMRNEENVLTNMKEVLVRRGPDSGDSYISDNVGLVHRRLVVIDPKNGKQPMQFSCGNEKYTIVYNGELYNSEELRKELIENGYTFYGHCDTEVLLKSYVCWKEACVDKLNGIYAFAIWDEKDKKLFMARDRIGVKPLFFYPYNSGIIFGSEIKALLKNPLVKPVIDDDGLKEILLLGPGRTLGCGVIKGIDEVMPGEFVTFSKDGLTRKQYWKVKAYEHTDSLSDTIEKTRYLIIDAIKRQLVSDVPLCCFLSGGLDSSIISKVASIHYSENGLGKLSTYSVDYVDNDKYFKESSFQPTPDREFIDIMVSDIDSIHHNITLKNEDLAYALEDATIARDLPGMADIDSSLLLFSKEIKKNFTVAVSGECADEIFAGYPWYHNKEILFKDCFPWAPDISIRKNVIKEGVVTGIDEFIHEQYINTINRVDKLSTDDKMNLRMREMFMLNFEWFMQTLLDRKDRMTMYNGLEVRVPFCDYRIVEYAYNMPWEIKALNGREKGIVREAMRGILPDSIIDRKKSPYPKTHNPIYFKIVSDKIKVILNDKTSFLSEIINKEFINEIMEDPDKIEVPWYGQLMRAPQLLAYLIQIEQWIRLNKIIY